MPATKALSEPRVSANPNTNRAVELGWTILTKQGSVTLRLRDGLSEEESHQEAVDRLSALIEARMPSELRKVLYLRSQPLSAETPH